MTNRDRDDLCLLLRSGYALASDVGKDARGPTCHRLVVLKCLLFLCRAFGIPRALKLRTSALRCLTIRAASALRCHNFVQTINIKHCARTVNHHHKRVAGPTPPRHSGPTHPPRIGPSKFKVELALKSTPSYAYKLYVSIKMFIARGQGTQAHRAHRSRRHTEAHAHRHSNPHFHVACLLPIGS